MAASASSTVSTPAFHADDPEEAGNYRTVSVLAILCLVFGVLSPLALIGLLLIALPLFGIALGFLALRHIAVSENALTGRWAAILGIGLCVAGAVAPFSRDIIQTRLRSHQAEVFARNWLKMVAAGEMDRAFRMTYDGTHRAPLPDPGAPAPKTTPYEDFLNRPIIKAIRAAGKNAEVRLVGTLDYQSSSYRLVVLRQQFVVLGDSDTSSSAAKKPLEVIVTIQRAQLRGESMSRWLIGRCDDAATASTSTGAR
jgi:hypothetical protein